jgi:hypothetical protein
MAALDRPAVHRDGAGHVTLLGEQVTENRLRPRRVLGVIAVGNEPEHVLGTG